MTGSIGYHQSGDLLIRKVWRGNLGWLASDVAGDIAGDMAAEVSFDVVANITDVANMADVAYYS